MFKSWTLNSHNSLASLHQIHNTSIRLQHLHPMVSILNSIAEIPHQPANANGPQPQSNVSR